MAGWMFFYNIIFHEKSQKEVPRRQKKEEIGAMYKKIRRRYRRGIISLLS